MIEFREDDREALREAAEALKALAPEGDGRLWYLAGRLEGLAGRVEVEDAHSLPLL